MTTKVRASVRYAEKNARCEEGEFSKNELEIELRDIKTLASLKEAILADSTLGVNPLVLDEDLKASEVSNTSQNPYKLSNGRIVRSVETLDGETLILDITLTVTSVDWSILD